MQRPAWWIALCYTGGLLAGRYLPIPLETAAFGLLFSVLFVLKGLRTPGRSYALVVPVTLSVFGAGVLWYIVQVRVVPETDIRRHADGPERIIVEGRIDRDPDVRDGHTIVTFTADSARYISSASNALVRGRVQVRIRAGLSTGAYGDRAQATGWLLRPSSARNPGGFDALAFYESQGIHVLMSIQDSMSYRVLERGGLRFCFILRLSCLLETTSSIR
ncbi:MAG: DUF4131 domain-containing protein [candidate division Zixibacteria bacterium]|nr:DUF4131 domain-containing protein [candidate division Zixibacteria bacterium]